jgi:hypothetical protein
LTGDGFAFYQIIEADMVSDFAWGTAGAQPVTLSFWVIVSLAGTFGGAIRNAAANRSYPFAFTLAANVWTKIVITIPGDTAGTWVMSGNAASLTVMFDLGSGATLRGPAGAWAAANYFGSTGAVSVVATNAATFYVTSVKLEIGSVATPYNRQSTAKSMADCQRYFYSAPYFATGYNAAGGVIYAEHAFPVTMRAQPTVTYSSIVPSNSSTINTYGIYSGSFLTNYTVTATGNSSISFNAAMAAEL